MPYSVYDHSLPDAFPFVVTLSPAKAMEAINLLMDYKSRSHKGTSSFAVTADTVDNGLEVNLWLSEVSFKYLRRKLDTFSSATSLRRAEYRGVLSEEHDQS